MASASAGTGTSSQGGAGGGSPNGGGGSGGHFTNHVGGGGGVPTELDDSGLVVRYFMDEGSMGENPIALEDASQDPFGLPIGYAEGFGWYEDLMGNRGLRWAETGSLGRACALVGSTKVDLMLTGSGVATIEAVVDGDTFAPGNVQRIVYLAPPAEGTAALLLATDITYGFLKFELNSGESETTAVWDGLLYDMPRHVIHVVLDSSQPVVADRVRGYRNGVFVPQGQTSGEIIVPVDAHEVIGALAETILCIGNRPVGDRWFGGAIHYVAIYASAFDAS
jgi:hypothetical protein